MLNNKLAENAATGETLNLNPHILTEEKEEGSGNFQYPRKRQRRRRSSRTVKKVGNINVNY